jgi:hypothetical protein
MQLEYRNCFQRDTSANNRCEPNPNTPNFFFSNVDFFVDLAELSFRVLAAYIGQDENVDTPPMPMPVPLASVIKHTKVKNEPDKKGPDSPPPPPPNSACTVLQIRPGHAC